MPKVVSKTVNSLDPQNINGRLYKQCSVALEQLEKGTGVTLKERIAAIMAITRAQYIFLTMRLKGDKHEPGIAGSAVRKYSTAFQAHDARRRKAIAGPASEPDELDLDAIIGDDRSA